MHCTQDTYYSVLQFRYLLLRPTVQDTYCSVLQFSYLLLRPTVQVPTAPSYSSGTYCSVIQIRYLLLRPTVQDIYCSVLQIRYLLLRPAGQEPKQSPLLCKEFYLDSDLHLTGRLSVSLYLYFSLSPWPFQMAEKKRCKVATSKLPACKHTRHFWMWIYVPTLLIYVQCTLYVHAVYTASYYPT